MADGMPGRPRGLPKTGGRTKGTPNKATVARAAALEQARKEMSANPLPAHVVEMTAYEMLLRIARWALAAGWWALALEAAKELLPYERARLAPAAPADPSAPTAAEIADDTDPEIMPATRLM